MTEQANPLDRAIDETARQMLAKEPSPRFAVDVMARIEALDSSRSVASDSSQAWWIDARIPVVWRVAAIGAAALIVLFIALSRQPVSQPVPADLLRTKPQALVLDKRPGPNSAQLDDRPQSIDARAAAPTLARTREGRSSIVLERLPTIAPIEEPPIVVDPIDLDPIGLPDIELTRLEIAPVAFEPADTFTRERP